jgi:hypothetical protein
VAIGAGVGIGIGVGGVGGVDCASAIAESASVKTEPASVAVRSFFMMCRSYPNGARE